MQVLRDSIGDTDRDGIIIDLKTPACVDSVGLEMDKILGVTTDGIRGKGIIIVGPDKCSTGIISYIDRQLVTRLDIELLQIKYQYDIIDPER
jgi:hypothetical protein